MKESVGVNDNGGCARRFRRGDPSATSVTAGLESQMARQIHQIPRRLLGRKRSCEMS